MLTMTGLTKTYRTDTVETTALDALVCDWHGQGPVHLPGRVGVRRESGRLVAGSPPREV